MRGGRKKERQAPFGDRNPFGVELSMAVFDRATRIAKSMFAEADANATIVLVHEGQAWRSRYAEGRYPPRDPIAELVMSTGAFLWIEDARLDPRFADHPMVVGARSCSGFASLFRYASQTVRPRALSASLASSRTPSMRPRPRASPIWPTSSPMSGRAPRRPMPSATGPNGPRSGSTWRWRSPTCTCGRWTMSIASCSRQEPRTPSSSSR